ncbi:MAG: inorganic phosphate transporter [Sulfurospirillum sp.]|nr:MAG: inorganic phosphate transporter [Sulfurospirillum sp.]
MEINTLKKLEKKARKSSKFDFLRLGLALMFIAAVLIYSFATSGNIPNNIFLAIATMFGAYMAMNIGANDVANNVGPAVGSKALTMGGAIIIAGIFEASGALIAGGDVVKTIKKGIIDIGAFGGNSDTFIWAMMAALLAAALWLNLATYLKAPVSTTHSIVGGVMGGGIAAAGFSIVNWGTMGKIAASWIISPILGGAIAAGFLYAIKNTIIYKENKVQAAKKWVPVYIAIMSWAFVTYLTLKGLKHIWKDIVTFVNEHLFFTLEVTKKPSFLTAIIFGLIVATIIYLILKVKMSSTTKNMKNDKASVNALFTIPMIFSAALLSFAHGANDVANAVGPLAAINDAIVSGGVSSKASIPLWIMGVGGLGIAIGLALYGPKLIKTVGSEITELDQTRAFSVAMAAAITVIIASQLGLPVSSTHIAVGGVFGVGFLREWIDKNKKVEAVVAQKQELLEKEEKKLKALVSELETLENKSGKKKDDYKRIVKLYQDIDDKESVIKGIKKSIKTKAKQKYVKREALNKIIAAWLITVPAAAIIAALIFFMMRGMLL